MGFQSRAAIVPRWGFFCLLGFLSDVFLLGLVDDGERNFFFTLSNPEILSAIFLFIDES